VTIRHRRRTDGLLRRSTRSWLSPCCSLLWPPSPVTSRLTAQRGSIRSSPSDAS